MSSNYPDNAISGARIVDRPISRRSVLISAGSAAAGLALLGLTGCTSDGNPDADRTITVSINPDLEETFRQIAQKFNSANSGGPTISLRVMPTDTGQHLEQIRTQLQAGVNDIDVILGDVTWPAQLAVPGYLVDLSQKFTSADQAAFLAGTVDAMKYDQKIYGVPLFTDAGLLYHRADLLEASGFSEPPQTWEQLVEMAKKVQTDQRTPSGFLFTGANYEGGTVLGTEFIRSAGGDVLSGKQVVIDQPEAIRGLTIQQSLVRDGVAPPDVANYKEDEAVGAFMRGDAVFMRMWPYAYDFIGDTSQTALTQSQVGLSQLPVASQGLTPVNVGGGWNFYINAATPDVDAAWRVIQFMSDRAQQKELALQNSVLPTRSELYDDPEIRDAVPAVREGGQVIKYTTTPPVSPYYSDMSLAMAEQFNANVRGDVLPDQAAANLAVKLRTIIERGG